MNNNFIAVVTAIGKQSSMVNIKRLLEDISSGVEINVSDYKVEMSLDESSANYSNPRLVKEKYGTGLAINFGDVEYRYVSDVYSPEDFKAKIEGVMRHQNTGQIKRWLEKNSMLYWSSKESKAGNGLKEELVEKYIKEGKVYSLYLTEEKEFVLKYKGEKVEEKVDESFTLLEEQNSLNESRTNSFIEIGETVKYKGSSWTVADIEKDMIELEPDNGGKSLFVTEKEIINDRERPSYEVFFKEKASALLKLYRTKLGLVDAEDIEIDSKEKYIAFYPNNPKVIIILSSNVKKDGCSLIKYLDDKPVKDKEITYDESMDIDKMKSLFKDFLK